MFSKHKVWKEESLVVGLFHMLLKIQGLVNSNWIWDVDIRKSNIDYVFSLCGGAISWMSR